MGYDYLDNTPEDIRDVVAEMIERLDGTFEADVEYVALLQRYYDAREKRNPHVKVPLWKELLETKPVAL